MPSRRRGRSGCRPGASRNDLSVLWHQRGVGSGAGEGVWAALTPPDFGASRVLRFPLTATPSYGRCGGGMSGPSKHHSHLTEIQRKRKRWESIRGGP
jgi:hypothetical protein